MALIKSLDLAPAGSWFKSSYSGDSGNACVEFANLGTAVGIRDSKQNNGPAFVVAPAAFAGFIADVRAGHYDI